MKDRNLEIYLKNPTKIDPQKMIVQKVFDEEFVYSWADMNSSLFSALKVERGILPSLYDSDLAISAPFNLPDI